MSGDDASDDGLGQALLAEHAAVPTGRLGRAFKTGRSALGLARTMLRSREDTIDVAAIQRLTRSLGELRGLGMKVGQILSFIDPSLPPETRAILAVLQRHAPASEPAAIRATIEQAFGARAPALLEAMSPQPIAVASIAQVHRAALPEHGEVAVKVRHPGMEAAIRADFASARSGLGLANAVLLGAAADARGALEEAAATLLAECDFRGEADAQTTYARWLAADPVLRVPAVVPEWTTDAVLTTSWLPGLSLDAFLATSPPQSARDRAGEALFRASVGGFYALGLLHADPHPGNYAFADGHVILYDFGCVRRFTPAQRAAFAALREALADRHRERLTAAGRALGFALASAEEIDLLERFGLSFFAPMLTPGARPIPPDGALEARQMMRDKRALMRLGLPPALLFLLRLRFGLYAVLARLGACCDWGALEHDHARAARS